METINLIGNYPECKDCATIRKAAAAIRLPKNEKRIPHFVKCSPHKQFLQPTHRELTVVLLGSERLLNIKSAILHANSDVFLITETCPVEG